MSKKYYCPICGYESDEQLKICPICSSAISTQSISETVNAMEVNVSKTIQKTDYSVPDSISKQEFSQHKFISDIYECEKQKYILEKRIKDINIDINKQLTLPSFKNTVYQKNYNKKKKIYKESKRPSNDDYDLFTNGGIFIWLGVIITVGYSIYLHASDNSHPFINTILSIIPIMIIVNVVGLLLFPILRKIHENSRSKEYSEWHKKEDAIKEEIDNYNKELMTEETRKYNGYVKDLKRKSDIIVSKLTKERKEAYAELNNTKNTLTMLYNLRINGVLCLHPNYQGLVPISVIYGYFDTGRCTQLQGHEGAYNLYEDEKMKGMIINKLDIVSQQLGQLNTAMTYVGQAIELCNDRLSCMEESSNKLIRSVNNMNSNISNQINGVSSQMSAIEENTANSAYYAEVGAKMTTFNTVYNLLKD